MSAKRSFLWSWRLCLAFFMLAGLTGAGYRFALSTGATAGFDLVNIRHAHSHLMYFGWVTPALFTLIGLEVARRRGRPPGRALHWILGFCFLSAFASYPLFLLYGYNPVQIGDARLPIAVIASTSNMLGWYGFVIYYALTSREVEHDRTMLLWDIALTFLVLATLGAGGLAFMQPLGIEDPTIMSALTHMFLDYFSEGWFVLAILGVGYVALGTETERKWHWSLYALVIGLPLTFVLGMPASLVPQGMIWPAAAGATLVGTGLLVNAWILWQWTDEAERPWLWRIPLALLAMKAAGQLLVGVVPGAWWTSLHGLRILYLHMMLLGFVTLGLVAGATYIWGAAVTRGRRWLYGAVLVVLVSLVPLTRLWPSAWGGGWTYDLAAWLSVLPVLAALVLFFRSWQKATTVRA